jgi:hypothetical protein
LESAIQQTLRKAISYKHKMKLILPSSTLFDKNNQFLKTVYDDYEELFDYEKKEVKQKKATGLAQILKMKQLGRKLRNNILKNLTKKSTKKE